MEYENLKLEDFRLLKFLLNPNEKPLLNPLQLFIGAWISSKENGKRVFRNDLWRNARLTKTHCI